MNERQERMNRRWYKQWLSCGFTGKMEDRMNEYGWFRDRLDPATITKITVVKAKEADIEVEYTQLPNGKWVTGRWLTTKVDCMYGSVSGASIWDAQYDTKGEAVTAELDSILDAIKRNNPKALTEKVKAAIAKYRNQFANASVFDALFGAGAKFEQTELF